MHVPGYPRALQAIGNVFSHVQYEHLIANMMYLLLAGAVCHDLVGRGIFLGTYVSAGAVGTLASLYWANLGRGIITAHSVGASAAIWGISTLYLLLTDTETITIPFIKDMEVAFFPKLLLAAFVGLEVANAIRGRHKLNDHASHFGGIAVGASVAGYLHATGFMERRRRAMGGSVEPVLDPAGAVKAEVEGFKAGVKKVIDKEVPTK
jgi:rhomboid-like protein